MTLLGYARVSTVDQNTDLQTDALNQAGCERVWVDHASGATTNRPQLAAILDYARAGDTIVVWRLDRFGRSLIDLIRLIDNLDQRGIHFRSLTDGIDTSTPNGRLVFHLFASLAEFERDTIRERTQAGLTAAKARGRVGGRRSTLNTDQVQAVKQMSTQGKTVTEIARIIGTSRQTIYRTLNTHTDT
ncbi:MAG: recombinase family protein [Propionibacteriaceae bacterium]|jgi:DNA invertase Pin-like site-specific DNA recombinase|nr:recombinase family protein [Propionibacteriaceae bacterium]